MNNKPKNVVTLCVVLVISGGLVGLAARSGKLETTEMTSEQQNASFLNDPNLSDQTDVSFASKDLFVKMMFSVALVVVLGVAALYLSKKVLPKVTNSPGKEIHILETAYLGPRKALHLVEVGNQKLLIGSTNETIATLAHMSDPWLDMSKQEMDETVKV